MLIYLDFCEASGMIYCTKSFRRLNDMKETSFIRRLIGMFLPIIIQGKSLSRDFFFFNEIFLALGRQHKNNCLVLLYNFDIQRLRELEP